ncbi:GTP-binding protein LepA [Nocardioides sp.]|uniref:GTP-binding protein LepA n=1 Tax=Nocardioides sp. TaxID=35761 RepID=UPI0027360138|nr:GTP-binding protein LepA [Nocardioides sp.]MDP3893650.1 GTP-binding protein LepA [Nocardioides sp.]
MTAPALERRLAEHVDRIEQEHPPIPLDSVDYSVHRPLLVRVRYGHVLDYLARVELEVDRNVLELVTLLPDAPEVDRRFYADVWHQQEIRHGVILDELQQRIGRPAASPDTDSVSAKIRILGALAHLTPVHDVVRMIYYLTGMSTERSAVLAYNRLHDGLLDLDETAIAATVVAPIRRQEPGHYAFYRMSATGLAQQLSAWQRWLVGRLRRISFAPVGANNPAQRADFGAVMTSLGVTEELDHFAREISRVERDLLWARHRGMDVPPYVLSALREAVDLHAARH